MRSRFGTDVALLLLSGCACEGTTPADAGRALADASVDDAGVPTQPCASRMETIPLFSPRGAPTELTIDVVTVDRTVWVFALERGPASHLVVAHWSRAGGVAVDLDEEIDAPASLAGVRRWPGGFTHFTWVGDTDLRRLRFDGTALRGASVSQGVGRPLLSTSEHDDLIELRAIPSGVSAEVTRWGRDGMLSGAGRDAWSLAPTGALVWRTQENGLFAAGFMASSRGPWRGFVRRFDLAEGFVDVATGLALPSESPEHFGPLSDRTTVLLDDGTVVDLSSGGTILATPDLGASRVQDARFGNRLRVVGTNEPGPFVDPSERHYNLPLYYWELAVDGSAAGGMRPVHTGSCGPAALDLLPGDGVAIAHTCFGDVRLTLLCAEGA